MRPVVITGLKPDTPAAQLDELLRVFKPFKIDVVDDGAAGSRKAYAFFHDDAQARECAQVVGLRPDLVRRRLGAAARVSLATDDVKPQPLGHVAVVVIYGDGRRHEGDDFDATTYRVATGDGASRDCATCDGEFGSCLACLTPVP